ncbi:MAG: hypothetical protein KAJ07_01065 [Planctomycetes bacterium]|nr:hypothetical protein [Planctomycetota bacterium]
MKRMVLGVMAVMVMASGCEVMRFGASEMQKENAWLHNATASAVVRTAKDEGGSEKLVKLSSLGELQSRAFVFDYGLPKQMPAVSDASLLSQASFDVAGNAINDSQRKVDVWATADGVMEVGIALAGLLGGAYGIKAAAFLATARKRSKALQEIVKGNEVFKQMASNSIEEFKQAHKGQSLETKQIVSKIKTG